MAVAPCGRASAPAACARIRPSLPDAYLSDTAYLGLGLAVFVVALLIQLALYASVLQGPLRSKDILQARPALMRWIKIVLAWQVLVVVAAASYVAAEASRHAHGAAWVAPAIGAIFGTALPLQVVVVMIMRAGRR